MLFELSNMLQLIISTISSWSLRFVDVLRGTFSDLIDNLGWLKEIILNLTLPDWFLEAQVYEVLFGAGAFVFVFLGIKKLLF